jgi:nucleoside-diphosphate-sugar epimerase
MRVLIVGGTGLISTSITRQLLEQGVDVTLYNRGQTEARNTARTITGDRQDFATFEAQMADAGHFDCVIDMICYTLEEAESDVRAFQGRAGHFIFCSTVDVYSKPATRYPYVEDEPHAPVTLYGKNKSRCEAIMLRAHESGAFPMTIIRPAHTYGESRGLIHSFGGKLSYIDRIRKGKPIVVHGDGTSLWVSCHIDDVARAFVTAMGKSKTFGKAYHTTGEEWQTWNRYHQGVAEALGAPPPTLVHIPTDLLAKIAPEQAMICADNFQFNNIFDNAAAHADLDFRYTIPWIEGVKRTVAWLDSRGLVPDSDDDPYDDRIIAAWQQIENQLMKLLAAGQA